MIKYESIISSFDDKDTLYNWLRKVEEQLKNASATGFVVNKKGNATLSFSITFANGETLESGDIVLQQGESVNGAYIQNGHLYLTLTNGTNLDAGNVKPVSNFSIDANQHLIVNYGDGTSQDLGAIFNGNVTISGNLTITGNIVGNQNITGNVTALTLSQSQANNIFNISLTAPTAYLSINAIYNKCIVVNNVMYVVLSSKMQVNDGNAHTNVNPIAYCDALLDYDTASKIFDIEGNDAHATLESSILITSIPAKLTTSKGNIINARLEIRNATAQDHLYIVLLPDEPYNIDADEVIYVCARGFLTLL